MAIALLRREPAGDAPGRPPPPRLRPLQTHVVHQHLSRVHPHRPHWVRGSILLRNRDRWHVIVCMSVPNTGIQRPSWFVEKGSTRDRHVYCTLQRDTFMDPPDVEPECP